MFPPMIHSTYSIGFISAPPQLYPGVRQCLPEARVALRHHARVADEDPLDARARDRERHRQAVVPVRLEVRPMDGGRRLDLEPVPMLGDARAQLAELVRQRRE